MARRLIGTGTTDSNGRITVSYTGTGAGKLQLVAVNGNLLSEIYELIDGLFVDNGTSSDYSEWTNVSNITVSRSSTGTTLTPSDSFSTYYKTITDDMTVFEFDVCIVYTEATNFISFRKNSTSTVNFTQTNLGLTSGEWSHVKLVMGNDTITLIVDGEVLTSKAITDTLNRFYFVLDNTKCTQLQYRNFVIY